MNRSYEILHSEGADSVVIGDTASHDDIAEIFHNERHTVNQTVEQALETARLFAAAPKLLDLLVKALPFVGAASAKDQAIAGVWASEIYPQIEAAIAAATGIPA